MKVFLTGGSGLLGSVCVQRLQAHGHEVIAPSHHQLELTDFSAVRDVIKKIQPDIILNCAAQRRPDLCESAAPEVIALNERLPFELAQMHRPLLHISTDYVFNGTNAPYEWDARRSPINAYGCQKAAAEAMIEEALNVLLLRLPILYGPTTDWRNSAVTVLAANLAAAKGAPVKMDDLAIRYPTFTVDIAEQIVRLLQPMQDGLHGIVHYSGEEAMTKFQMALHLAPYVHVNREACVPDYTPPLVPRPYDCHLSTRRLKQLGLFVTPTSFEDALQQLFS